MPWRGGAQRGGMGLQDGTGGRGRRAEAARRRDSGPEARLNALGSTMRVLGARRSTATGRITDGRPVTNLQHPGKHRSILQHPSRCEFTGRSILQHPSRCEFTGEKCGTRHKPRHKTTITNHPPLLYYHRAGVKSPAAALSAVQVVGAGGIGVFLLVHRPRWGPRTAFGALSYGV